MRIISLKATNIELTDAITKYVEEKVGSLEKLVQDFEPAAELSVEVGKTTRHHAKGPYLSAEMMLQIPGELLRATEEAEDLYAAIDLARDALRRQIIERKERLIDKTQNATRPDKE
ncbi:ribosome-associated translation inhibitor RaiA [Candidatus Uhrbacteria bacterium]|nr:ribosome-associated translation inhibitor RaiA [Candidatus Uhrbacteria bacterium]MBI4598932.1 ribosome-associated translation inhibitor RaiA [Candidatus Uhrbacteria bacterium]